MIEVRPGDVEDDPTGSGTAERTIAGGGDDDAIGDRSDCVAAGGDNNDDNEGGVSAKSSSARLSDDDDGYFTGCNNDNVTAATSNENAVVRTNQEQLPSVDEDSNNNIDDDDNYDDDGDGNGESNFCRFSTDGNNNCGCCGESCCSGSGRRSVAVEDQSDERVNIEYCVGRERIRRRTETSPDDVIDVVVVVDEDLELGEDEVDTQYRRRCASVGSGSDGRTTPFRVVQEHGDERVDWGENVEEDVDSDDGAQPRRSPEGAANEWNRWQLSNVEVDRRRWNFETSEQSTVEEDRTGRKWRRQRDDKDRSRYRPRSAADETSASDDREDDSNQNDDIFEETQEEDADDDETTTVKRCLTSSGARFEQKPNSTVRDVYVERDIAEVDPTYGYEEITAFVDGEEEDRQSEVLAEDASSDVDDGNLIEETENSFDVAGRPPPLNVVHRRRLSVHIAFCRLMFLVFVGLTLVAVILLIDDLLGWGHYGTELARWARKSSSAIITSQKE